MDVVSPIVDGFWWGGGSERFDPEVFRFFLDVKFGEGGVAARLREAESESSSGNMSVNVSVIYRPVNRFFGDLAWPWSLLAPVQGRELFLATPTHCSVSLRRPRNTAVDQSSTLKDAHHGLWVKGL